MLFAILLLLSTHPMLPQDPPILVNRQRFDCLVKHIDRLPSNRRLVYVDIRRCPPQVLEPSYPRPPVRPGPHKVEWVLSLDRAEIACIRKYRRNIGAFARREGADKYRVDFGACARRTP